MIAREDMEAFLREKRIIVAGASRDGRKFGNAIVRELKAKGYEVIPMHPEAESIEGLPALRTLSESNGAAALVLSVQPQAAVDILRQAGQFGIHYVWLQRGAESEEAIRLCKEQGITAIYGQCLLMYAEPTAFFHRLHRWMWSMSGKVLARAERKATGGIT